MTEHHRYLTEADQEALTTGLVRMGFDPIVITQMVKQASRVPVTVFAAQGRRTS
ncbi:hypothetical protein [Nocardia sp. NPDC004260]